MHGRETELARLLELLRDENARCTTVTGRYGVGKTRLAVEAVALILGTGRRVVWSELGSVDASGVLVAIARDAGVHPGTGIEIRDALARHFGDDDAVVVLDGFEHVLESAGCVAQLLDRCPHIDVLTTSQAPLRLPGERVLLLEPLPIPAFADADFGSVQASPAVALYCDRAAAVDHTFALDDANVSSVAQLCTELDGLPLAIALAAARAATLSAAELCRRLPTSGVALLRRERIGMLERHNNIAAAIVWAIELLAPAEQRLLRHLSVFTGSFDVDAAIALGASSSGGDAVVDQLETLVDFHLIDRHASSAGARFVVPSAIRTFARDQLDVLGGYAAVNLRRITYRSLQARACAQRLAHGDDAICSARMVADGADLLAALSAALDADLAEEAIDLVVGLANTWEMQGFYAPEQELFERTLKLAAHNSTATAAYANALAWSAVLNFQFRPDPDQASLVARVAEAEALALRRDDPPTLLRVLATWIVITPYTGDLDRARAASLHAHDIATRANEDRWVARIEAWSGMLAQLLGEDDRAALLGRSAVRRARKLGDERALVLATMLLMPLQRKFPELELELPPIEEALAAARSAGLRKYEALLLPMMVADAAMRGEFETALNRAEESLAVAQAMDDSPVFGYNMMTLSLLAEGCGDPEVAVFFYGAVCAEMSALGKALVPSQVALYDTALQRARAMIGDGRFAAEARRGNDTPRSVVLAYALTYVREKTPCPEPPGKKATNQDDAVILPLTVRQREVLELLAAGLSNKEIASRLGISPKTVMHHTLAIYRGLGVRGRAEAAVAAMRLGISS